MTAIYWRNLEKRWQNGETESQKNGGVRQAHPPKIFIWITAWKSGCKDSGMEGGKKMLCLGIFSTRHKHTTNVCLWNSSVFGVCWEYWNGWSNFLPPVILLCAVSEVNKLPLNFSAKKKQFIDCNHWLHPEIVCTIFLHPWKGGGDIVGCELGNWPCKLLLHRRLEVGGAKGLCPLQGKHFT